MVTPLSLGCDDPGDDENSLPGPRDESVWTERPAPESDAPALVRSYQNQPGIEESHDFGVTWHSGEGHVPDISATRDWPPPAPYDAQMHRVAALARTSRESAEVNAVDFYVHPSEPHAYAVAYCNAGERPPACATQVYRTHTGGADWERATSALDAEQDGQMSGIHNVWTLEDRTVAVLAWSPMCETDDTWQPCGERRISYDGGETFVALEHAEGWVRHGARGATPWNVHRMPRSR